MLCSLWKKSNRVSRSTVCRKSASQKESKDLRITESDWNSSKGSHQNIIHSSIEKSRVS